MPIPKPAPSLTRLPPYLFVRLNAVRNRAEARGKNIIDLGMGNPDRPTPGNIVRALAYAARTKPWTHRYPQTVGLASLRRAAARFYRRRFGVRLDPDTEVLPLIGSKEGLAHLCSAYLSPGDAALVTNPCYPVHINGPKLFGGRAVLMPLKAANDFLPDLRRIPSAQLRRARFMILNYPNNPTAATVDGLYFFREAVRFARRHGLFVVHDNAYSELCFDGYRAPSFLQVPGAKRIGIEFYSLSKTYSMAGWRVGFALGNPEILAALGKFKSFLDYGIPGFIQQAAIEALQGPQASVQKLCRLYRGRRDVLCSSLEKIGWTVPRPRGTMYLWARIPKGRDSLAFAERLILDQGVVLSPGTGFGPHGEGYVRISLVAEESRLREAARRIGKFLRR